MYLRPNAGAVQFTQLFSNIIPSPPPQKPHPHQSMPGVAASNLYAKYKLPEPFRHKHLASHMRLQACFLSNFHELARETGEFSPCLLRLSQPRTCVVANSLNLCERAARSRSWELSCTNMWLKECVCVCVRYYPMLGGGVCSDIISTPASLCGREKIRHLRKGRITFITCLRVRERKRRTTTDYAQRANTTVAVVGMAQEKGFVSAGFERRTRVRWSHHTLYMFAGGAAQKNNHEHYHTLSSRRRERRENVVVCVD